MCFFEPLVRGLDLPEVDVWSPGFFSPIVLLGSFNGFGFFGNFAWVAMDFKWFNGSPQCFLEVKQNDHTTCKAFFARAAGKKYSLLSSRSTFFLIFRVFEKGNKEQWEMTVWSIQPNLYKRLIFFGRWMLYWPCGFEWFPNGFTSKAHIGWVDIPKSIGFQSPHWMICLRNLTRFLGLLGSSSRNYFPHLWQLPVSSATAWEGWTSKPWFS